MSKGNLDDRLATVTQWEVDHTALALERWTAHRREHETVAESLRDYKHDANEWRSTLQDLRLTFIPKAEFQSEHRALDAKLHGEIQALAGIVNTIDARLDQAQGDIKTQATESSARRSVFSDSRNVLATAGIVFGLIATALLILDRVAK